MNKEEKLKELYDYLLEIETVLTETDDKLIELRRLKRQVDAEIFKMLTGRLKMNKPVVYLLTIRYYDFLGDYVHEVVGVWSSEEAAKNTGQALAIEYDKCDKYNYNVTEYIVEN